MTDPQKQIQDHNQAVSAFIDLANRLHHEEGFEINLVSAALMAASGAYATFMAAGNTGFLAEGGVDKVVDLYRKNLEHIQELKRQEFEAKGLKPRPVDTGDGNTGPQDIEINVPGKPDPN